MTIATPFSKAWSVFINRSLLEVGLKYGSQFLLADTGSALKMDFSVSGLPPTVNLIFKIINIRAQIGPGWAE